MLAFLSFCFLILIQVNLGKLEYLGKPPVNMQAENLADSHEWTKLIIGEEAINLSTSNAEIFSLNISSSFWNNISGKNSSVFVKFMFKL